MPRFLRLQSFFLALLSFLLPVLSASPIPTDVTILNQADLVGRNIFSVGDALEGLPSINMEREGGRGTRAVAKIRGGTARDVIVLIDGRPLTHEFDSEVDLTQIPINIVDRIEITRGGSSVSYTGEAVAGVINIVTTRPDEKGFHARLGTGIGRDGIRHSHGKFLLRNYFGDLAYMGSLENGNAFSQNGHHNTNNHFFNISRSFNGKGFWGAEYYFETSKAGVSEGTPVPFDQWNAHEEDIASDLTKERNQESQHAKVYLSYPEILGGTINTTMTQSLRDLGLRTAPNGDYLRHQKSRSQIVKLSWGRDGFELGGEKQELRREVETYDNNKTHHSAGYVLKKWSGERWSLTPGVRVDDDASYDAVWTPRLAGVFRPHKKLLLSFSSQRAHRSPTYDELFLSSGVVNNPKLEPEKNISTDFGMEINPSDSVSLKWTGFFIKTEERISVDPVANMWMNRGRGEKKGIESEASWEFGKKSRYGHLKLTGNHTYQISRVSTANDSSFIPAATAPSNLAFIRIDHFYPRKITVSHELRYESEQYENPNHTGVRIPSHYVWNIRVKFKILKADLYVDAENVTRRRTAEGFGTYTPTPGTPQTVLWPQPERTFWAGLSIKFDN